MKKITTNREPSSPAPIEMLRTVSTVIDIVQQEQEAKIPPSVLYNSNLKKMKGFHNLRSNMKRESFLKEFVSSGSEALGPYEVNDETKYDVEIVKFMMQTAEDTFIHYKKQGAEKRSAVIAICRKYFDDNEVLVSKTIEQMLPFINKSNFWRRNRTRIYNIACLFLGMFQSNSARA
jgi:hypothetical protein